MNELLRDTLAERARGAEPPAFDLDGVVAAGDRRITRRRLGAVVGGAAVVALTAGLAGATRSTDRRPAPAESPIFAERRATYAVGSEIHYGQEIISVAPYTVHAFVQTDAGFVFLDDDNAIHVANHSGVRHLGKHSWQLTGPATGSLVGWVETFADYCESVVYDVAAQRELVRTSLGNKIPPNVSLAVTPTVAALAGDVAYFDAVDGLYRWDLQAGSGTRVNAPRAAELLGVSAEQYLYRNPDRARYADNGLLVSPQLGALGGRIFPANQGYLSPDATYLLAATAPNPNLGAQAAALDLYVVGSGTKLPLRHPDHSRLIFDQWLDNTTFTAVGVRVGLRPVVDLLTCSAASLSCKVSVPAFSTYTFDQTPPRETPFVVPSGTRILQPYG